MVNHPVSAAKHDALSSVATSSSPILNVAWETPAKISGLGLFFSETKYYDPKLADSYSFYPAQAEYYRVGQVVGKPVDVIFASITFDAPGPPVHLLILRDQTVTDQTTPVVVLTQYSDAVSSSTPAIATTTPAGAVDSEGTLFNQFTLDADTVIPDLEFPANLTGPGPRQTLALQQVRGFNVGSMYFSQGTENFIPAFADKQWGQISTATSTNAYYITRGPYVAVYSLQPDFFDADALVPKITFTDGTVNKAEYSFTARGGCGSTNYLQVVDPQSLSVANDLSVVGKNSQGDLIYQLKDSNHPWLKSLYKNFPSDPPLTYQQFLASRPLLYWVDPFGRLVELQNAVYQPQAECGKPVIYLYPTTTTLVTVKVEPRDGMITSVPTYGNGWTVVAEPNSSLTEASTTRHYDSLYWEGRGGLYDEPKTGWVVAKAHVQSFLQKKLLLLGLNAHEASQFLDFWMPKLQVKPYYFFTFMDNRVMDILAPLTVTPKPDTVIRILMDFSPLDKPIKVQPFTIHTPIRRGFTVVEWGGVLRRN